MIRLGLTFALLAVGSTALGAEPATTTAPPPTVGRLADTRAVRARLGLAPAYDETPRVETIKVAVLDYGFEGMGRGRAYLPEGAVLVEDYDPEFVRRNDLGDPEYRKPFEPGNSHGRTMAQIIWAVAGSRPKGPKFYLLNANGPTMLRRAVRYAIEERVDVILFSGSFEGGGDGDGRGPINRVVSDAVGAGIIWINAAGNYGHRVYNGPIRPSPTAISGSATGPTSPPCGSGTGSMRTPSPSPSPGTTTGGTRTRGRTRTSTCSSRTGPGVGSDRGRRCRSREIGRRAPTRAGTLANGSS